MIVTLALPKGFEDPNLDPLTAPVWVDSDGVEYMVASGFLEPKVDEETLEVIEYVTSDPVLANPYRANIVVGMDGLTALGLMGLTVKESELNG